MGSTLRLGCAGTAALMALAFSGASALAGSHTWRVNEIFSNASGTVQFIELKETCNGSGETGLSGHQVSTNAASVNLANLPPNSSASRHLLIGTANLPSFGGPTPDFVVSANFLSLLGDLVQYTPYHACTVSSGTVPTNGTSSLNRSVTCGGAVCPTTVALNSPTNFAGQSTPVSAGCTDNDGDGYGSPGNAACPNGPQLDCNDAASAINPGAAENCDDSLDNNCNALTDCDEPACAAVVPCIPTVSQWGVIVMASLVLTGGTVISRKRTSPVT